MEGKNVDRAPLTPDVERDLDRGLPIRRDQALDHGLDQRNVSCVEETVQSLATPRQAKIEPGLQGGRNPIQGRDAKPIALTTFRAADLAPTDPDPNREVILTQSLPLSQRAHLPANADDVHPSRMGDFGYLPLTSRSRPAHVASSGRRTGPRPEVGEPDPWPEVSGR